MSGMERSPRRTPVRRARTTVPGPSDGGGRGPGVLFANVERDEPAIQLPFTPQHGRGLDSGLAKACPSSENLT